MRAMARGMPTPSPILAPAERPWWFGASDVVGWARERELVAETVSALAVEMEEEARLDDPVDDAEAVDMEDDVKD